MVLDLSPDHKSYSKWGSLRLMTGEEIRCYMNSLLSFGSRGLIFDGDDSWLDPSDGTVRLQSGQDSVVKFGYVNDPPDTFLDRDEIGGDFLQQNNPKDPMRNYITIDTVAKYLKIDTNRFFFGRKSMRKEIKKISDLVRHNDSLFMNLKLVAGLSKGFRKYYVQDPSLTTDTIMKKYIDINSGILTRPIGRTKTVNGQQVPYYENEATSSFYGNKIDSAFYSVTLMKDNRYPNMDSLFYVYVVNRRTGPHIILDSADCGKKDSIQFFATAELEDSIQANPAKWSKYYYKTLGSRSLILPFNICNSVNPDQHYLIKVTEVKTDNAYNASWPWWRKERFRKYTDTVISGTSPLEIDLLPGAGKLFSVQILKPQTTSGNLAYNNQHKLINYPIYDASGNETDSIRYHLVYHKKPNPRSNIMAVYYQRSKPVFKNSDYSGVIWDNPINISDTIKSGVYYYPNLNCAYPSIVIRKDGSIHKAYIVYSCADALIPIDSSFACPDLNPAYYHPICEAIISLANDTTAVLSKTMIIKRVKGYFPADWSNSNFGLPVNNAVASGNFTTWGDSICGIGIAFKLPSATTFLPANIQYFKKYMTGIASHPSANAYSEIDSGANDCSVVWQEKLSGYNSQIYYTRFRWAGSYIQQFRPTFLYKYDQSINYLLSNPTTSNTFPTIYRTPKSLRIGDTLNVQQEVIAWESFSARNSNIGLRSLKIFHNNSFVYGNAALFNPTNIMGCTACYPSNVSYYQPVLSQPSSYANQVYGKDTNYRYLLNFVKYSSNHNIIEHFEPTFQSTITSDNKIGSYNINNFVVADGKYPHLAISPKSNNLKIWKNRRVFEDSVYNGTPIIQPNAKYFYAEPGTSCCPKTSFFGHNTGLAIFSLSNINVTHPGSNMSILPYNLPYQEVTDTVNGNYYLPTKSDTLYSDWFHVDTVATLSYMLNFNDTNSVKLRLQRQSTGTFTSIPAPFIPNSEFMNLVYFLVNGANDNYRMAMITLDTNSVYNESIIENFFIADTIYAKGAVEQHENHQIINLRPEQALNDDVFLDIHPNPANEYLNVVTYTTNSQKVNYTIYNSQGLEVLKLNGRSNYSYQIDTQNLKTGMYIVKTETDIGIIKIQKLLIAK